MQTRQRPSGLAAERERRLRVLHELALQAKPLERESSSPPSALLAPEAPPPTESGPALSPDRQALWRRAERQRLVRGIGLVVLLALVALAVIGAQVMHPFTQTVTQPNPTGPLTIASSSVGIGCPNDATWGPDGTSVALIGRKQCNSGTNTLALFDATSGKLRHTVNLDAQVDGAVTQMLGAGSIQSIRFEQVLWSRTGRIAALFIAYPFDSSVTSDLLSGVVLTDENAATMQTLAQLVPPDNSPSYNLWDLTSGRLTIDPDAIASPWLGHEYAFATLYPGLQYSWGFSGDLYVAQPLPSPGDPNAATLQVGVAVGSPTNGGSFSLWQFGFITVPQNVTGSGITEWISSFGAWAPDGSRIVDSLTLTALLQPLGQPSLDESRLGVSPLASAPVLAVRDAGMQAVISGLETNATTTGAAQVAWRPDGKVLAAIGDVGPLGSLPKNQAVTLYDCVKGTVLATLNPPPAVGSDTSQGGWPLRWSPSGDKLMLYDPVLNALVIWGPNMLPK